MMMMMSNTVIWLYISSRLILLKEVKAVKSTVWVVH